MLTPNYIASHVSALCGERGVTLRYCNESGSRAWGLESTDSDYDVRFIYQHPPGWYLQLVAPKDMIGPLMELNGELDMAGWDLRKVLLHIAKSNPGTLEWLYSPTTYVVDENFLKDLRKLATHYFNPHRVVAHYLGIARSARLAGYDETEDVWNVKKYCYYIRPILAASYVAERGTMPPVAFAELLGRIPDDDVIAAVADLTARKAGFPESHRETIDPAVANYFDALRVATTERLGSIASVKPDWAEMNEFFRRTIGY